MTLKNNNLKWFASYHSNRKRYVQTGPVKTNNLDIECSLPQGSILEPFLFILYITDFYKVSNILEPIMFADGTNLVFSHKNIEELFNIVNLELCKALTWFNANKLSLKKDKPNIPFSVKLDKKKTYP